MIVEVGLADDAEDSEVLNPLYVPHDTHDLFRFGFEDLQVVSVDLCGELSLDPAHRLFHVVRYRLREVPGRSRDLLELATHGSNKFLLILVKNGAPLILRLKRDTVFGVEKSRRIQSIIGAAHLAG